MNIYLLVEDGDSFCIRAKTMAEAVNVCEGNYLRSLEEESAETFIESKERDYYHEQILQSCALVAELKN